MFNHDLPSDVSLADPSAPTAVALRPSGIFGENDALMPPTTVRQCRRGKMRFIIGDGKNVLDW